METNAFLEWGVGATFVFLVLTKVLDFLKNKKNGSGAQVKMDCPLDREGIIKQVDDLYQWHNVRDPDTGGMIWYHPKSLEKAIEALAENIKLENQLLRHMVNKLENVEEKIDRLK